jgi:hypothetical protein
MYVCMYVCACVHSQGEPLRTDLQLYLEAALATVPQRFGVADTGCHEAVEASGPHISGRQVSSDVPAHGDAGTDSLPI